MSEAPNRENVSTMLRQRRRALLQRPEISDRVRQLSASESRHPLNPRRSRRPTLIMGVVAGGALLVMLVCGIGAVAIVANGVWFRSQLDSPAVTAQSFYGALHEQDFTTAYSYLSDSAKAHVSLSTFTSRFQAYDQVDGIVESYLVTNTKVTGSGATVQVAITRSGSDGLAVGQTLDFVQQSDGWHINAASPPLWS